MLCPLTKKRLVYSSLFLILMLLITLCIVVTLGNIDVEFNIGLINLSMVCLRISMTLSCGFLGRCPVESRGLKFRDVGQSQAFVLRTEAWTQ